ncbi:hypothetical protein [Achromobacter insolitus]|uniref:hypothetical protein n=1 Tax=Achromobacter insolitus TaxID=217204 RepID=UPI00174E750B|nr:hypothetical protein [Achromobacter insolitus]
MKKRNLYAEIAEGFAALSHLRNSKTTSFNVPAPGAGLAKTQSSAWDSEDTVGDSDAFADEDIVGRPVLEC